VVDDVHYRTAEALAESDATRQAFNRDQEAADLLEGFPRGMVRATSPKWLAAHTTQHTAAERERRAQVSTVKECEGACKQESVKTTAAKKHSEEIEANIGESRAEIEAIEKHEHYKVRDG